MNGLDPDVLSYVLARERDGAPCRLAPPAVADGPVADTAQPIAAEAGRPIAESDGNHGDAMPHKR